MILSVIIAVVGLIMYFIATNPKVSEVGRIMFWVGLLAFLLGGGANAAMGFIHH